MSSTSAIKTKREFGKQTRRLKALLFALKYPSQLRAALRFSVNNLYEYGHDKIQPIPSISSEKIVNSGNPISLLNPSVRNGNVSYLELLILASMVSMTRPKNLLEIGTFDGNTTLQIALNAPNSKVHTIDLPSDGATTAVPIEQNDLQYVIDSEKKKRKYLGTPVEQNIVQHLGDSTNYDFNLFLQDGPIDFCFIDGGHSYECVKSDTENTLNVMSQNGVILWHDYNPNWPGVYQFLNELSSSLPLRRFEGTNLVVYSQKID
jgi:hypothetical protein